MIKRLLLYFFPLLDDPPSPYRPVLTRASSGQIPQQAFSSNRHPPCFELPVRNSPKRSPFGARSDFALVRALFLSFGSSERALRLYVISLHVLSSRPWP